MGLALPTTCSFSKNEKQRMKIEMGGPIELRPSARWKAAGQKKISKCPFLGQKRFRTV
jgi:hypothetical protein